MDFEIFPFVGAGPLRFGMTTADVAAELGSPDQVSSNYLGQRVEFRGPLNAAFDVTASGSLIHIGFGREASGVRLRDIELFEISNRDAISRLQKLDADAGLYLGYLVFPSLGVALTGFHDDDISQKAISVYTRGSWEKRLPKLQPFFIRY